MLALATIPASAEERLKLRIGTDYITGDYGTGQKTDIWSLPLTGKYEIGSWVLGLVVPYIRITSAGDVVGGTDAPIVTDRKGKGSNKTSAATAPITTGSGLGDIVASAGYGFRPLGRDMPFIEFTGKIKIPTADEDSGLGTGEFDYTFQIDISKAYGRLTPFAMAGYRIIGEPDGSDLDNIFLASFGAGYRFSDRLSAGVAFDFRQSTTSAADDPAELSPYLTWNVTDRWGINIYALFGISQGSPDQGAGLNLSVNF